MKKMASNWYIMFAFALVLVHVVTARNVPQAEIEGVTVNTEVISRAPAHREGLDDKNNFISFGGVGGLGGIGGDAGGIGGLGGVGGDRNGVGGLGGVGGIGVGGGVGGVGGIGGIGDVKP